MSWCYPTGTVSRQAEKVLGQGVAQSSSSAGHVRTRLTYASPEDPAYRRWAIRAIEVASGRRGLERMYWDLLERFDHGEEAFFPGALSRLDVSLDYDPEQLARVPREGPLIVVANHPFGIIDGLAACQLIEQARGPFKVLVHALLCQETRLAEYLLPVDFDETRESVRINIRTKRDAIEVLRNGGTVLIFPSGGVSTSETLFGEAVELEWKTFVAKLVQQARANVLPLWFEGQNGRLFHLVSKFSMTLRLSLLMRETRKMMGHSVGVRVGDVLPFEDLDAIGDRKELTEHLKQAVENLGRP